MSSISHKLEQAAVTSGLRFDETRGVIYGQKNGFEVVIQAENSSSPYMLTASLSAKSAAGPLSREDIKMFVKGEKSVAGLRQEGNLVKAVLKVVRNKEKLADNVNNALNAVTFFLKGKGFAPCCQFCGQQTDITEYNIKRSYMQLCPDCASRLQQDMVLAEQQKQQKHENVIGGIVGAVLGSLIGVLCMVVLAQLQFVASISGVVLAICALKGYEILGGKLTRKGIVISVIVMIFMTYAGHQIEYGIAIAQAFDVDIFTGILNVSNLLREEMLDVSSYWTNLFMLYAFTVLGAVPTVRKALQDEV